MADTTTRTYTAEEYEEAIAWLLRNTVAGFAPHRDGWRFHYAGGEYSTLRAGDPADDLPVALRDVRWPDDRGVPGGGCYFED